MKDSIHISELELLAHIGVPEIERAQAQLLTVTLTLDLGASFDELEDRIGRTVDYVTVCERVQEVAAASRWQLIESLAAEIARRLLEEFPIDAVEVALRKYVLPETRWVAVRLRRSRLEQ